MRKVIVIGSGIAALSAIKALGPNVEIHCITKDKLNMHNSNLAQGGICFSKYENDYGSSHIQDTYTAGNELGDLRIIQSMIQQSHNIIQEMIDDGLNFDKKSEQTSLDFAMEGAHSKARILHIGGDQTGSYITKYLIQHLPSENLTIYEETEVVDLLRDVSHEISGVVALDKHDNKLEINAHDVILATGGYSNLFPINSSASQTINSGHIVAYHNNIHLRHMEMIQFHPTLLGTNNETYGLVSEAVRGHGGILVNEIGHEFMNALHPLSSLAPRDVTSRAIFQQQKEGHQCYINIKHIDHFSTRFPTIYKNVVKHFPDAYHNQLIPVSPGAHYTMGGVKAHLDGTTEEPHFFAIGEASNTNFHGANRLASNSLLEGLVMGSLCGRKIKNSSIREIQSFQLHRLQIPLITAQDFHALRNQSFEVLGIERNGQNIQRYLKDIQLCIRNSMVTDEWNKENWQRYVEIKTLEMVSLSALNRNESRGVHFRTDYPHSQPQLQTIDIEIMMEDKFHAKQVVCPRKAQTILP
ncbi:L-aspartate oxidase [Mammaliicoccus lentus]|uniref:L-aspartate oxidase n=1 Tax=Mammaliicoccus lentus TaxID=42858 RepID=UPI001B33F8AD|nr:FAD-binding protein [Mammaliicoccus lentus]